MKSPKPSFQRCRGVTILYVALATTVLVGLAVLAVDVGRMQLAKGELQRVADAAARAGAAGLTTSSTQARNDAISIAAANTVDGSSLSLSTSDIEIGSWSESTFTPGGTPSNAVRVTARRTAASGNPLLLTFARVFGQTHTDLTASSIAYVESGEPGGLIGLNSIKFKNNFFIGSYSSNTTTTPAKASAGHDAMMGSNGSIDGKNNNKLQGDAQLGPSGDIGGVTVTGSIKTLASPIAAPEMPEWSPGVNPGGISQNYTVSSNQTLPGGTYWFTKLTVNATLTFSSPATVHVNGDVDINSSLRPSSLKPADLTIYQHGAKKFGDSKNNNTDIIATIIAPEATMVFKNNFTLRGSAICKDIEFKNNAEIFYDTALGGASGGSSIQTMR
jgi:Flp pilus assembly protein TadG